MSRRATTSGSSRSLLDASRRSCRATSSSQETRDNDDETFQIEHGFIARATEQSHNLVAAYKDLITIYPDRRKNFEVNMAKCLEVYLNAVLFNPDLSSKESASAMLVDFAKAGFVVQGSTNIYSKKVEFILELMLQLQESVDTGVSSEKNDEPSESAGRRKNQHNKGELNFEFQDLKPHKTGLKVKLNRTNDTKLSFRPKCFPLLLKQEQGEADKKRITTLNPSFIADKTTFRLWGPVNGKLGLCLFDLTEYKYKYSREEPESQEEFLDDNDDLMAVDEEVVACAPESPCIADASALDDHPFAAGENGEHPLNTVPENGTLAQNEDDKENNNNEVQANGGWDEMSMDSDVASIPRTIKTVVNQPKGTQPLDIQEDFLKEMKNNSRVKNCFGEESVFEAIELKEQNKVSDVVPQRRKHNISILSPSDLAKWKGQCQFIQPLEPTCYDSDNEEVIGFTGKNGECVYKNSNVNGEIVEESEAPQMDLEEWVGDADVETETIFMDEVSAIARPEEGAPAIEEENGGNQQQLNDESQLAQRLEAWYAKINGLQEIESKKPHFTFNSYCTKVLQRFPTDQEVLSFKELTEGVPSNQISRYLLATLQLANTNNVEILNTQEGFVANEMMQVRLLNKTRQLPSFEEEDFQQ